MKIRCAFLSFYRRRRPTCSQIPCL